MFGAVFIFTTSSVVAPVTEEISGGAPIEPSNFDISTRACKSIILLHLTSSGDLVPVVSLNDCWWVLPVSSSAIPPPLLLLLRNALYCRLAELLESGSAASPPLFSRTWWSLW